MVATMTITNLNVRFSVASTHDGRPLQDLLAEIEEDHDRSIQLSTLDAAGRVREVGLIVRYEPGLVLADDDGTVEFEMR